MLASHNTPLTIGKWRHLVIRHENYQARTCKAFARLIKMKKKIWDSDPDCTNNLTDHFLHFLKNFAKNL